jgi:putative heme iron utilization protein
MIKQHVLDEARQLLLCCYDGVLSTLSIAVAGYPFGSVVPFCLDRSGQPVILIASIAQHHKNLAADGRCSLMVFDRSADDLQANGRLTLLADGARLETGIEDTSERYYRHFPEARDYHNTHGFEFWRLQLRRIRYIGGFGAIHWIESDELLKPNPFSPEEEASMVEHMNADHLEAMRDYLRPQLGAAVEAMTPTFAGVDAEGIHLRGGARVFRIPFASPVQTTREVRTALVELARQSRAG